MKGVTTMARVLLCFAGSILLFALLACSGEKKPAAQTQGQVTSPVMSPSEPRMDSVINLDEPPAIVKKVEPVYPKDAKEGNIEGSVYLTVLLSKEGTVKKAVVQSRKDGSLSMEKAAFDAVMQFTFTPARIKKQPVETWVSIPFRFKLAEKK
jgi:TonB family protein